MQNTRGNHFSTGPTTSSRHDKNIKLPPVPPPMLLKSLSTRLLYFILPPSALAEQGVSVNLYIYIHVS